MSTVKDVAKEAGVSVGTVSRYLNGASVKENNKKRIKDAIVKLDYTVNPIARGLKTNVTKTIGVVITDLTGFYTTTIVRYIEKHLYPFGYNIFVCDSLGVEEMEKEKVRLLMSKMVDGLIVLPSSNNISYLQELQEESGIPIVILDVGGKDIACDKVLPDNIDATYKAVEWLINNNHRRIGLITGKEDKFSGHERYIGYKRAIEDYGIDSDMTLVKRVDYFKEEGYKAFKELVEMIERPTAVIACSYHTTIGMIKAVRDLGMQIPEAMSIIGFDNLGLTEIVEPPLSIVIQPMEELGKCAADLILKRINRDFTGFPTTVRLKTEFLPNKSIQKLQ